MNRDINLNMTFDKRTNAVPIVASTTSPAAHKVPIAATHHRQTAVLRWFLARLLYMEGRRE